MKRRKAKQHLFLIFQRFALHHCLPYGRSSQIIYFRTWDTFYLSCFERWSFKHKDLALLPDGSIAINACIRVQKRPMDHRYDRNTQWNEASTWNFQGNVSKNHTLKFVKSVCIANILYISLSLSNKKIDWSLLEQRHQVWREEGRKYLCLSCNELARLAILAKKHL